jgi:hypothetical protein
MRHTRIKIWGLLALGLTSAAMAQAQTYDLDITMTGVEAAPITFSGSFTYNSSGTGFCSAPFCGTGVTPDFSNIHINDPILGTAFTAVQGGSQGSSGGTLTLTDFLGSPPSAGSSEVYTLGFSFASPLGGSSKNIGLSNITLEESLNVTGIFECGTTSGVSCPTASLKIAPAAAPEIDPASAVGGFALLFGSLAVMRGRRRLFR